MESAWSAIPPLLALRGELDIGGSVCIEVKMKIKR